MYKLKTKKHNSREGRDRLLVSAAANQGRRARKFVNHRLPVSRKL